MSNQTFRVKRKPVGLTHLVHRQLIGWVGILLPVLVVVISWLMPILDMPWTMLDSISAFYYTSANGVFVGSLFALSMFLFTYGGYDGDHADRVLGKIAGTSALGVAFLPMEAPRHFEVPRWWLEWMGIAHYTCAILLFLSFIAFAMWIFRRTSVTQKELMSIGKRFRNHVFLFCGVVMIVCVLWAVANVHTSKSIFLPESIALVAFAISWLVKGKAYEPAVVMFRRFMN